MPETPAELSVGAACFGCIPKDMQIPALIYLFNLLGENMTPAEIVENAACFQCIPADMQMPALLYLAGNISAGGGGSDQVSQGSGVPVAPPADPTKAALYTDLDSDVLYTWNVTAQAWE